jgi:5-formyltetrahydrofolate cyclo-ligase
MAATGVKDQEQLRTDSLARRDAIDPVDRLARADAISNNLDTLPAFSEARAIGFYYATGSEVPSLGLVQRVVEVEGRRAFLPFLLSGRLELAEWRPSDPIIQGREIPFQPRFRRAVPLEEVDAIVVPGLVFDRRGRRLGSGQGLYEGLLSRMPRSAARIGIAFADQVVDDLSGAVPAPAVDFVVTEDGVVDCRPTS